MRISITFLQRTVQIFWREIGNIYKQNREDWNITSVGTEARFFLLVLMEGYSLTKMMQSHTFDILSNSA